MTRKRCLAGCLLPFFPVMIIGFCPEPLVVWQPSSASPYFSPDTHSLRIQATTDTTSDEGNANYFSSSSTAEASTLLQALEDLYPSDALDQRIATSRKDGYWPFIRDGHNPPSEFVYGEFDLNFLFQVLKMAVEAIKELDPSGSVSDWVFTDLGSGTGRLVLGAAGFYPWKLCRGIELLPGIHEQAIEKLESCLDGGHGILEPEDNLADFREAIRHEHFSPTESGLWLGSGTKTMKVVASDETIEPENIDDDHREETSKTYSLRHPPTNHRIPLAPIEFRCGSFTDPYEFFGDTNVLFCFSSCLPSATRVELAKAVGRQCQPGTIVITTEYQLSLSGIIEEHPDDPSLPHGVYNMELLATITGENESTGGLSTVYIHRVNSSVGDGIRREPPVLSIPERAYRAIKDVEVSNDPAAFVRRVANEMIFSGFPDSWIPPSKKEI